MPIPSSFTDLDTNPNNNSPQGSENVGPNANGYIQALGSFIRQIYNGTVKPTATVDFNAQKLTNIANGSVTSASKDAITGAQARALAYKIGEIRTWHGTVANITTVWGAGWQLADGTNGTADLRDRFIVGAGFSYAPGNTGGAITVALTTAQLPAHNHAINDPGHTHGYSDPGHSHGVNDPGHFHALSPLIWSDFGGGGTLGGGGSNAAKPTLNSQAASTGIWLNASPVGINIGASATGITTQNNGSGAAHENRPPYYALCFLEYTGIGA